jgi:hypothetical protein
MDREDVVRFADQRALPAPADTAVVVVPEIGVVVVVGGTVVTAAGDEVVGVAGAGDAITGDCRAVVVVDPYRRVRSDGSCTGLTNTMMQAKTTRQAAAMPSSLRLRCSAPSRAARKKPLNRKNRMMLTELLTAPAYQKRLPTDHSVTPHLRRARLRACLRACLYPP